MDPKKPKIEETGDKSAAKSPAEQRADSLISGKAADSKPEPGQASQRLQEQKKAAASGKPALTEKQRIEARRQRQAKRRRPVAAGSNALSRGVRASGFEIKRTALFLGRGFMSGIDSLKPAGEAAGAGFVWLVQRIGAILVLLVALIGQLFAAIGRVLLAVDKVVTARRALVLVAVVASGLLVASQFSDYRALEIGQAAYAQVNEITRAPRTEVKTPMDVHSFLLVGAGLVALVAVGALAFTRKRIFGLVIAAAGAAALIVALAVDLPAGLDAAEAELSYSGVKAILLTGFWLELAAGAVLLVSGLSLTLEPSRKPARARERRTVNSPNAIGKPA